MKKQTVFRIIIIIVLAVVLGFAVKFTLDEINSQSVGDNAPMSDSSGGSQDSSDSITYTGANELSQDDSVDSQSYDSTSEDENAVLVTDGASVTFENITLTKSGDSTNTENSEFYGVNAGFLVTKNSSATISNSVISTSSNGSNAVFATGENAKITVTDSTITTTGDSSARGLDATYGGYIEAERVTITTYGGSCAALATDRGEGTIIARNSTLETNGSGSPVIYSTGDITLESSEGTANAAQCVVVEGKNSATVTDSSITSSAAGNRGDVDVCGVMIYQSMSGDAGEGTGTFTSSGSALSIQPSSDYYSTAPMFFVTNTEAVINLSETELSFGSGILLSAQGTDEWGEGGSNGGDVTLNADSQTLSGDIVLDDISSLEMNLTSSNYSGIINGDNASSSVVITLDEASSITLTGDSYVTELNDSDSSYSNIDFNGYTLYVNGTALEA